MVTVSQTSQFQAWLRKVTDPIAYDAIVVRTVRMESGLMGDTKSVGGKVSEARVDVGQGYRLFYTRRGLEIVLLLCGGDKSSQAADIARAKNMVEDLDTEVKAAAAAAKKAGKAGGRKK